MTRAGRPLAALLLALVWHRPAAAHEVRPGYLELRETAPGVFATLWKVPARGDERFAIHPVFPPGCVADVESVAAGPDAWVERGSVTCPRGLAGGTIAIDGLAATMTDVLVRVVRADASIQVARLTPAAPSFVVDAAAGGADVARTYVRLGLERVLHRVDRVLFVLALVVLVGPTRRLVSTVAAFALAQSLTLAAATLGVVRAPPPPVEAVLALGLAFVAAEIVRGYQGRAGIAGRRPWMVALVFGLLHGFGSAGALAEVGLPGRALLALFAFNVGVLLGLLACVAGGLVLLAAVRRPRVAWPAWAWRVPAYAVGAVAAYWTIERVAGF